MDKDTLLITLVLLLISICCVASKGNENKRRKRPNHLPRDLTKISPEVMLNVLESGTDLEGPEGTEKTNHKGAGLLFRRKYLEPLFKGGRSYLVDQWTRHNTSHDAHKSWQRFMRRDSSKSKNKQGRKNKQKVLPDPEVRGPQGPPGPRGLPGAEVTVDVIMEEFKQLVKEEADRRAEQILAVRCPGCVGVRNETIGLLEAGEIDILPRITAGFFQTITKDVHLPPDTLVELKHYVMPFGAGSFQRGNNFSSSTGRYNVPRNGIYNVIANLHIRQPGFRNRAPRKLRRSELVRALICIDSQCQNNTSVGYITGLSSNSGIFTINFSGYLQLTKGQYISIYVDNSSRRKVAIVSGSNFIATLVGT